jgi:peptide/nickel transport system permease protein
VGGLTKVAARFAWNRLTLAGLLVFGLLVLETVLEVLLVGWEPDRNPAFAPNLSAILQGPSAAHPLGTDVVGRDAIASVLLGTSQSMLLALAVLALATAIGALVLVIGAVVAGKRYAAVTRVFAVVSTPVIIVMLIVVVGIVDPQPPFPPLLNIFGLVIQEWAQPSSWSNDLTNGAPLLITLFLVGEVARFGYLLFRSLRPAQAHPAVSSPTPGRIPVLSVLGPAAVTGLWIAGDAVLVQNVLSFYGIGAQMPVFPLSGLIADAENVRSTNPLLFFVPLILLVLMVLSLNVVGLGLHSALRELPRQRSAR